MSSTKFKAVAESTGAAVSETIDATSKTVNDAAAAVAGTSKQSYDTTLSAIKDGVEKAAKGFETSQAKLKENVDKLLKTTEEMVSFSQGNLEALLKATQIYAAGVQDISRHFAASSKVTLEDSVSFTKSLLGVKSVKEAVDLQSEYAKATIEKTVQETSQLTDASVKLAEQAIAPLTARVSVAVQTFSKHD